MSVKRVNSIPSELSTPRMNKKVVKNRAILDDDKSEIVLSTLDSDKRVTRSQAQTLIEGKSSEIDQMNPPKTVQKQSKGDENSNESSKSRKNKEVSGSSIEIIKASRKTSSTEQVELQKNPKQRDNLDFIVPRVEQNEVQDIREPEERQQEDEVQIHETQEQQIKVNEPVTSKEQIGNTFNSIIKFMITQANLKKFPQKQFVFDKNNTLYK
jgi:hypothetical protein